jgi:hypothetical protein
MLGYITLALQIFVLFTVGLSCLLAFRSARLIQETAKLIQSYRSQMAWLEARMELLEGRPPRLVQRSSVGGLDADAAGGKRTEGRVTDAMKKAGGANEQDG